MPNSKMPSKGAFFIATGERYTKAACDAARSVKRHCGDLEIALSTDFPELVPDGLFSHVLPIEDPHARSKVDEISKTPFEKTLYLDTDVRLLTDISEVFDLLDRFDIALAHAHARNREATKEIWQVPIPDSFPQFNGGLMLYRRNDRVLEFLYDWSKSYRKANFRKDQVTLRELIWTSELSLYVLPPEYNIRYSRYLDFWDPTEAEPRLLHLALFHDKGQSFATTLKRRVKEIGQDFRAAFRSLGGAFIKLFSFGRRHGPD